MPPVTMYTTPTCVYCRMAKKFFTEHNISFQEKDVVTDIAARNDMIAKSGQMGVPVIDVGGKIVIGFDQAKLRSLLGISS